MADSPARDDRLSDVERWILARFSPERSTTAELTYERMESQSGRALPVIYVRPDPTNYAHWHDEVICAAFVRALRGARRVLDIGPGDGWPSLRIAWRVGEIVGIDPSPRRVSVQRENAARLGIVNVDFQVMDALSLGFPDASFDGVTAASSIEQTGDPARALREAFRVLKSGGRLAMIFEDYATYFPGSDGDEELWSEVEAGELVLFYQHRTKSPPREATYALFLDAARLDRDAGLASIVRAVERNVVELENLDEGMPPPTRPESLGVPFFESLAPFVARASFFELRHLTSSWLDRLLADAGFVKVRHFSTSVPEVRKLFDASKRAGRLEGVGPGVWDACRSLGAAAADGARPSSGDFAIAEKPRRRRGI